MRTTAIAIGLASVCLLSLSGCNKGDPGDKPQGATALVIGNRQNMPRPGLIAAAAEALTTAVERGDRLVIVSVTGDPKVVGRSSLACPYKTTEGCKEFTRDTLAQIPQIIGKYPADTAESSLLAAIKVAKENISAATGPQQIITIDSGLDTAGPLALTDLSILDADLRALGAGLAKNGYAPDLKNVSVLMTGLGQTMAPQQKLTAPDSKRLSELWATVLEQAGAKKAVIRIVQETLPDQTTNASLPRVSVTKRPADPPPPNLCRQFDFNEAELGFVSDKAVFVNRAKAKKALQGLGSALIKTRLNVVLTGTTAYKETNPANPLSNARAALAKSVLVEIGVPPARILTQGVGISWPGYKDPKYNPLAEVRMRLVLAKPTCPS